MEVGPSSGSPNTSSPFDAHPVRLARGVPAVASAVAFGGPPASPRLPAEGRLTVMLPVHNEADSISPVLEEVARTITAPSGAELLVCEDGSSDRSAEVLLALQPRMGFRLFVRPDRRGYGPAVAFGMQQVRTPLLFFMDSDGQYAPEDFWTLWNRLDSYDMVIGRKTRREEPLYRTILSRGFHLLVRLFTGVRLKDMDCGFRIVRREVWEAVLPEIHHLRYSFWAEFSIRAVRKGFRVAEAPVEHRARLHGTTTIYRPLQVPRIVVDQVLGLVKLSRELKRRILRDPTLQPRPPLAGGSEAE